MPKTRAETNGHACEEHVIRENVRRVAAIEKATQTARTRADRAVDATSAFCGSVAFVYIHLMWFGAWIGANLMLPERLRFDPFPFGLLTMVVSLEAILLSTFILITQNRQTQAADRRHLLDLQIDLLAERETTQILAMLDRIARHMGIETHEPDLEELERITRPEAILEEIDLATRSVEKPIK